MGSSGLASLVGVARDSIPPTPVLATIVSSSILSPPTATPTTSPIIGTPDVEVDDDCKLLGPFALAVQAIMGVLVIGSLVYKRQRETPKRKWKIWALDVSKQLLGQLFVHMLNVVLSDFVANIGDENPCSLYFLNILVDTTIGVFFIYTTLKWLTWYLTERLGLEGFVSGQYTPPLPAIVSEPGSSNSSVRSGASRMSFRRDRPRIDYWLNQLGSYLFVLFLMKLAVLVIFYFFPFLFDVGSGILGLFGSHKDFQVLFSMALFPFAMNVLQFWLIDSLLRHNPYSSAYSKVNTDDEDFINRSDRASSETRPSESRSSFGDRGRSHFGRGSTDRPDDGVRGHKPHASGSSMGHTPIVRRSSPFSAADQPYDRPPSRDAYGSVHKSPPLRPSRPLEEMRRQASLSLSDNGSDQDNGSASAHQPMPSLNRSESHHLRQVSTNNSTNT